MKAYLAAVLAGLLGVPASAAPQALAIQRFTADSPLPLLKGALLPADSELFFVSGQIASPIDPARPMSAALTAADVGDTRAQTISALGKVKAILEAHGYAMSDVVKTTVYLVGDPARNGAMDFDGMNEGFRQFFGTAANPNGTARATVQVVAVAYPSFLVEIEAIAARAPKAR